MKGGFKPDTDAAKICESLGCSGMDCNCPGKIKAPKEIYLQWNPNKEEDVEFIIEGTSWYKDKINDNDLRYIHDKEIKEKINGILEEWYEGKLNLGGIMDRFTELLNFMEEK